LQLGEDVHAMAAQRAREALMQGAQLGGQIRGQDFGEAAEVARAKDAINHFNASNTNEALKYRTGMGAQALSYNKQLPQQQFQDRLAKAGAAAKGYNDLGGLYNSFATDNRQLVGGLVGAGAQTGGQVGSSLISSGALPAAAMMSDARAKKDVKPADPDVEGFLDSIVGKKYRYKEPAKHGAGEKVGVMAQDLEKTSAGADLVEDTADGKVVDYSRSGPLHTAALANLHHRLKKLEGK
jgi:hypothetical protein